MLMNVEGPRNRAPLGNKTTNAKVTAFKTPAAPATQEKPSAKQSSPRMRRAKIKIHEAEAVTSAHDDGEEEPEVEFMPPREIPLPDYPDDCWPHDRTYPQFEGKNLTRGWWSEFAPYKDSDEDEEFSDYGEKVKKIEERQKGEKAALQSKKSTPIKNAGLQKTTRDPLTTRAPQTLKARSAASALGLDSKSSGVPSFAAPTATSKSRAPSALISKKPTTATHIATGNVRHGAARIASNSTLGYSKGRAVSGTALEGKKGAPVRTSLDDLFDMTAGLEVDEEGDEGHGGVLVGLQEDDELRNFQLDEPVEI